MTKRARTVALVLGGVALGGVVAACVVLAACGRETGPFHAKPKTAEQRDAGACPARLAAPAQLPGVEPEHRTAAYWVGRAGDADAEVMSPEAIADHNAAFVAYSAAHPDEDPLSQFDIRRPSDPKQLRKEMTERLAYMRERIESGAYVSDKAARISADEAKVFAVPSRLAPRDDELRVALADIPLRCGPRVAGLFKAAKGDEQPVIDPAFDRNNCSTIRPQEPLRIVADWPGGMKLVRTSYALGWIAADAPLSPPIPDEHQRAFVHGPKLRAAGQLQLSGEAGRNLAVGDKTMLADAGSGKALFATATGFDTSRPLAAEQARPTTRPMTRRAVIEEAFSYLDTAYGWGGHKGGRDCSRFLMDVLGSFGLRLPRHSGLQARAGTMSIDLSKVGDEAERLSIIDSAAARGIVLLHFPGHIMLYLGRSAEGTPMAIHAFAEYLEPCPGKDTGSDEPRETLRSVDRIQVSDLALGKGSSRRSFLQRFTTVTVLGSTPGQALLGAVERRPAAPAVAVAKGKACRDSEEVAMYVSPRRPHPGAPLRVIVTTSRDLGSVALTLVGPDAVHQVPATRTVGGPPFGYWATLDAPAVGRWTAQLGDGSRVEACLRFTVHERGDLMQANRGAVWRPRKSWSVATENLYSTFVEQLFDYPLDDRTWTSLQQVLSDRDHNILHNHLGQGEDDKLKLRPDCADLPYFLRAYFSWKMRLPFAYRRCNRGRPGKAPYCDRETHDSLQTVEAPSELQAFSLFARRELADSVHSGSGRTGPASDYTDYYPVPITREAMRPGIIFADPYGHLFVLADWIPQGAGSYGVLVGADAQPDGTVGRRRFWPGSFLFTPETREAGAGFKAFRPARFRGGRVHAVRNKRIGSFPGAAPFSLEQYEGGKEGFYDRVEALINPRPLNPTEMLNVLSTALYEQLKRRVVSVQNGEDYKASHSGIIKMPTGHAIFETHGAWENFSTPSRDMRLLIAMDTVLGFPDAVKRNPARFGLSEADVDSAVEGLRQAMGQQLAEKRFSYVRTDGSKVELSIKDVVDRAALFELAYNPNDCIEVRWAAPEGSEERSSCRRRAPRKQQELMASYRPWFAQRKRPPR